MYRSLIAATALALSASAGFAADEKSLSGKAMEDHPGTTGGSTATPTVKPESGSVSEKQMQDQPGVNKDQTGVTADPTAKPVDGSLSSKASPKTAVQPN